MTSRKRLRQLFTGKSSQGEDAQTIGSDRPAGASAGDHDRLAQSGTGNSSRRSRSATSRVRKRQHLLETLESRQMLAGPQLIGIQPNEGDLIVEGSIRNVAPRALTFRFDEVQQIDPATFDGIRITRAGADQTIGTSDDIIVTPGLVSLGEIKQNEVVVRFAEKLPDDKYRVDIFSFDDEDRGIVALRNVDGEAIQPSTLGARTESVNFELNLGALVEAVVPQPVVRLADGKLEQRRDEVLVYFNEDPLFVENDPTTGEPTARSAENPRFYQLLLTQDSVRTTDDRLYFPERVIYDEVTHTARLIFASDINALPGVPLGGGTFRLRVGTAVDTRSELILAPTNFAIAPSVTTNLRVASDLAVTFRSKLVGESASGRTVRFINSGTAGLSASTSNGNVVINFGGAATTIADLAAVVANTPAVNAVLGVTFARAGVPNAGGDLFIPFNNSNSPPLVMTAVGDTITTALDVGVFGVSGAPVTSLTLREQIDPQPFLIELLGGNDDPGRLHIPESAGAGLLQTINANFGADTTNGITEIAYNFQSVFESNGGVSQLNQITEQQKVRVREALQLWSRYLGVQFRETANQGITFARGATGTLLSRPNTQLTSQSSLNAALRIDPTFANSAMVLSNQTSFGNLYGEDFFRKTMAGIGFLLGLEETTDRTAQTLMSLSPGFLNSSPNLLGDLEPSFPGAYDILHGRHVHRTDSIDIDMYRFEVNLGPGERVGTLTAETFAERLPDSSMLDTTLTLFQDVRASVTTDFNVGTSLSVKFTSVQPGALGNSAKIEFIRTDRAAGDTGIRIRRSVDASGNNTANGIVVDVPRRGPNIPSVSVGSVIIAINNHPVASTLFKGELLVGSGSTDISGAELNYSPLSLSGGGIVQLSRNDDYFSEDSQLKASLPNGVYYVGIAASGNDTYDPTIPGSGFGGRSQGAYELLLKFEPQVNETDAIRDLDSARAGVPGTAIDGDGDGVPGGVNNFWFQTRPEDRKLVVTGNGSAIVPNSTFTITGGTGESRRFEFVPLVGTTPGTASPGNVAISYSNLNTAAQIADRIRQAIRSVRTATGVNVDTETSNVVTLQDERSIVFSSNTQGIDVLGRTIFVDKTASVDADGSEARPFNNIANSDVPNAFSVARPNDIVRIVGNGGLDNNPNTLADNFAYKVGTTETGGATLEDGRNMNVPQGVTVMIDAGAAFKLRNSVISVGSTNLLADRSQGVLQVLGTPRLVTLTDPDTSTTNPKGVVETGTNGDVIFTSTRDRSVDRVASGNSSAPTPGNWGGLIFRRDIDQSVGRPDLEDEGIFLQTVNHADIRFGGSSNILIDSNQQLVNPIQIFNLRPTVTFNDITFSADAAISASPDSFEETSFQSPQFQQAGVFTADYSRVGPAIHNNFIVNNSINGLFIRVATTPGTPPQSLTVAGRFDDIDVVHYIAENVLVAGTPGGSIQDGVRPDLVSTAFAPQSGGTLTAGTYDYRLTLVDANGFESLASLPSNSVTVASSFAIRLINLPPVQTNTDYTGRRLYRRGPGSSEYRLVTQLDATTTSFLDTGRTTEGVLNLTREGIRGRLDASLVIDPGTVVKFRGARLELGQGTQLLAEGLESNPVVFTSFADDRFGAGGTFDTNNDTNSLAGVVDPSRGDWSGIYAAPTSRVSLDHAAVAYAGGVSLIDGGQSRGFAALELQQADARITNSRFEFNEDGQDGAGPVGRFGRLGVTPSTIFVRGSQPIIVGNQFVDNRGSIIDIDSDSMTADRLVDIGRQTGDLDRFAQLDDNYGPLIRLNRYENVPALSVANRQISGLEIRGGVLATESVWDDTDIVHMLFDSITVGNIHSVGGLRLMSRNDESLVVKLTGAGSPFSATAGTGITATGSLSNIDDRIGGSVQIIGKPGAPVVLTSFLDDSVGAGVKPDGTAFTDTNGDSIASRASGNDWRSILLDTFSNDRNFDYILEQTIAAENAPGLNGTIANAQVLGILAPNQLFSDEQLRLGFEVEGFLNEAIDVDNYSFIAQAGTRVWLDLDHTSYGLDSVIEVLDADGQVLARSNNSYDEVAGTPLTVLDSSLASAVRNLQGGNSTYTRLGAGGLYEDYGSSNPRDAGLSLTLPGSTGVESVYFVRVRSASINPDDARGGLTKGGYRFQIRLQEEQEFIGSIVRFADIRFANHGVHVRGLNGESPLLGEAQENETSTNASSNNSITTAPLAPTVRAQYLGNLTSSENKVFSVGGDLITASDVDFYQIDLLAGANTASNPYATSVFDIDFADGFNRPDTTLYVFHDADGEEGPLAPRLVLVGENSNVMDDFAKPLTSSPIDVLSRGTVSSGDPFIGPIALSSGSYYVAVVGSGVSANALSSPVARREPIESLLRIFEDHVEALGGSTALPPREGRMFEPSTLGTGWTVTTNRATNPGHQRTSTFNGSRTAATVPTIDQIENQLIGGSFATAQDLDLGAPLFSLAPDQNIGSTTTNTSQFIPHTTVQGTTVNEIVDIYQFTVPATGGLVILDIDNGFNPLTTLLTPVVDPTSVNLKLQLFDSTFQEIASNSASQVTNGALGSRPNLTGNTSEDPFIQVFLPGGTYFVAVSPEATVYTPGANTFTLDVAQRPTTGTYELNVSVQNRAASGGDAGNQSIQFDRSAPTGTLSSVPFDLTGYGPSDLPRFYFNYFYAPGGNDVASVRAFSDQNPAGISLSDATLIPQVNNNVWNQGIASLAAFAGHTGIVVQFNYTTDVTSAAGEGLYLDDFLVGFAERGELITNAAIGVTTMSGFSSTTAGEYQLEVRPGTSYGTELASGIQLTSTFDTNARQGEAVTIIAPHASQIADSNTFTLSDGIRTVRFEFDSSATSNVQPGNVRIPFSSTSTRTEIADAIRNAINSSVVQSTLQIQASDSSGSAIGGSRDVKVEITGFVLGDFLELATASDLPAAGTPLSAGTTPFRLPVVFNRGVGDSNAVRAQSQVIVDSNKITHAHTVGIFSQPGDRGVDPEDQPGTGGRRPPMGSTFPGAVRNLPTLNNIVTGGQAPGIVIRNNTIDAAGAAGIRVDGENRPWIIDSIWFTFPFTGYHPPEPPELDFGDLIADGLVMTIDAGDTRVVFEFEDTGAPNSGGIGTNQSGGDGFADGHVPIYYRRTSAAGPAFTRAQVMAAIRTAIESSILVNNGLMPLVKTMVAPSVIELDPSLPTAASVYVEGATSIRFSSIFQKVGFPMPFGQTQILPIHEAPQPISRIVNNTIRGTDGSAAQFSGSPTAEPNDLLSQAIQTGVSSAHTGLYTRTGVIGDGTNIEVPDVDLYRVNLDVGDRLVVDVDTAAGGPNTVLRLFDANGVQLAVNRSNAAPAHLDPTGVADGGRAGIDPFLDFTALSGGTYFVGVSSLGNETYDPNSLSGRTAGTGGEGSYNIAIESYAPRSFVLSIDSVNSNAQGSASVVRLDNTTFTVTQIPDRPGQGTNDRVFRFTLPGTPSNPDEIRVPIDSGMRVPDAINSIVGAIGGSGLLNHGGGNGPGGLSGPIGSVFATAFGGSNHSLYAFVERAAKITLSPQAAGAGLHLDPAEGRNVDQLLPETGISLNGGSSATILNNVLSNLHAGIVLERTNDAAIGALALTQVKDSLVIVTANVFQHIITAGGAPGGINNAFRNNITNPFNAGGSMGITPGPSNINGGNDDFNITLGNNEPLFANPEGGSFLPASDAIIIDSSVNSLIERPAVADLRRSVGLPISNVLAPNRDVNGVLRADNPNVAPPGGLGSQVFKDRGSNELADFVGPVAISDFPRDNDPLGIDTDQATSFLRLRSGIYDEFRIQLRDTGDSSDPFAGLGIDDNTVVVATIDDLRSPGANITLFEGDRLLTEGIDYTFSYDTSKNIITLRPIAGLWRNDRAYRVMLNNRDRTVGIAPSAGQVVDGDSFTIVDSEGGRVNFEFDSGFQLIVPEALQFTVPAAAGRAGGIADGDLFSITGVDGSPVQFEFNRDTTKLPTTQAVPFTVSDSASTIAASARAAIAAAVAAGLIDVDVDVTQTGPTVVLGSDAGTILDASASGLITAARTIALRIPAAGVGPNGVDDGDTLTINDGNVTVGFEFDFDGVFNDPTRTLIPIGGLDAAGVLDAITTAIDNSALRLSPVAVDGNLFLALPTNGLVTVSQGQLVPVGLSRTPVDGDTVTLTTTQPSPQGPVINSVTLELSRDATASAGNVLVGFDRIDTADQIAAAIAQALQSQRLPGFDTRNVQANPGGLVSIGGPVGAGTVTLDLTLGDDSTLSTTGEPDVTGSTLLTILGPLLVQLPIVGGSGIPDDSQFTLTDGVNTVTFTYNLVNTGITPGAVVEIPYQSFQDADALVASTVTAINNSILNITAADVGNGVISLGTIALNQLTFPVPPVIPEPPAVPPPTLIPAPLTPRIGIVEDGERVTITQNGQTRVFEFESSVAGGGVAPGSIPVLFPPSGTIDDIATILAASINNNRGTLTLTATPLPGGQVRIADTAQTTTTTSARPGSTNPPTITISGQPGGAVAVPFTGSFSAEDMKRSIIDTINRAAAAGSTSLIASDRGGSTFFIENATLIGGLLTNYYLGGIKDVAGNLLEPTRADNTTQFTMLLPTVGLDFGDAPDPVSGVRGRYPTLLDVDGARHLVGDEVRLGSLIDIDSNGLPNVGADGDDTTIFITGTSGSVFQATKANGFAEIAFNLPADISTADGNTVTISTGVDTATFEFDTDGIFNENNFAVSVNATGTVTLASVAEAFASAVRESNLRPAAVVVVGNTTRIVTDDEDGVSFVSTFNPTGVFNRGISTPITVTVTGGGVLEAWIDFNADGDFTDPGEQIIGRSNPLAIFPKTVTNTPLSRTFIIEVPATTPISTSPTTTYARFRVSTDGGLTPTGLALSGEVEDYRITMLPGLPPTVTVPDPPLTYTVDEDSVLQARDADGTLTPASSNDNGALSTIRDPDGDVVNVFAADVGERTLLDGSGAVAGTLNLLADGTFSFAPTADFNGSTQFTFRVTDVKPSAPSTQLVSPTAVTVNLVVRPVNDRPFVTNLAPTVNVTIDEDVVREFTPQELTRFYSPGPANEAGQALVIQSAGINGFGFQTQLGGSLTLVNGNLRYTPPANFPGPGPDRFTYVVADDPNDASQLVQSAATLGTVLINIRATNDAPIAGTDSYDAAEDSSLTIQVNGPTGILNNDSVGPADELAAGQRLRLVSVGTANRTDRGGTIIMSSNGSTLIYTPPADFSGQDQFTYVVSDDGVPPQSSTGTVLINVGGDNDPPVFVGINGNPAERSLTFNESKETEQTFTYNLSSWFSDPEGDVSTFEVTSNDPNLVRAQVTRDAATGLSTLRLTLPSFRFGSTSLDIVATNVAGPRGTALVPIQVLNTPDPPIVIGTLEPISVNEDAVITRNLGTVFADPDGAQLMYRVSRFGSLVNPTAEQIAASPLVRSITFNGDNMTILLDADASGSVDIQIEASDGTFPVTDEFTLTVEPVADAPRGAADFYNVPLGGRFQIIDPLQGLLGNDVDPDGDVFQGSSRTVRVEIASVTQPTRGSVTVNADGTFTYVNQSGAAGQTDSFTYRPIDPTGLVGNTVTVTFNLGRSRYQNPIPGLSADVNANGVVSPLDALLILNRLAKSGGNQIAVSTLTAPPPNFFDVTGDGFIRPADAKAVIDEIAKRNASQLRGALGEGESQSIALASTVAYAAQSNVGLAEANRVVSLPVMGPVVETNETFDPFAAGFDVIDGRAENSSEQLIKLTQSEDSTENSVSAVDEVLSSWFDPTTL